MLAGMVCLRRLQATCVEDLARDVEGHVTVQGGALPQVGSLADLVCLYACIHTVEVRGTILKRVALLQNHVYHQNRLKCCKSVSADGSVCNKQHT